MQDGIFVKHSIVIPAYNEEKRIGRTLEEYTKFFGGHDYELIVVCDGCTDNTVQIVREFSSNNSRVKLFEPGKRLGKGGGVYYGFSKCTGDTIGFTDADNAVAPGEYRKLLDALDTHDCAIASRRQKDSVITIPNAKKSWIVSMRVASIFFNKIVNFMFGINIRDTQCGAKVMKKEVYEKIKKDLSVAGFEFDVELLWRIKKNGYSIQETGVKWVHDLDSKSSLKNSANMFFSLLKRRLQG